jgi:hypothetical protein
LRVNMENMEAQRGGVYRYSREADRRVLKVGGS